MNLDPHSHHHIVVAIVKGLPEDETLKEPGVHGYDDLLR
jgi:hypothetical protein